MKTQGVKWDKEVVENACFRLDESTRMIKKCLVLWKDEDIWIKPNEVSNSIGNLLLHICGNMTQYIISSLGEQKDVRNRKKEFEIQKGPTIKELTIMLERTVKKAKKVLREASGDDLLKMRSVQGFKFSGIGVVMHAVEHYSYHTGQIAVWTKMIRNQDLGFYNGLDLNSKNKI
ncbi:MAG: DinB family protein [Eudoraea sp.]|uniref:DinB family protein n=1 Tax=Eudoraea sp. TaxID=1979955 RepID=UPI003C76D50A